MGTGILCCEANTSVPVPVCVAPDAESLIKIMLIGRNK